MPARDERLLGLRKVMHDAPPTNSRQRSAIEAFGLQFDSDIECFGTLPPLGKFQPQVRVRLGAVPDHLGPGATLGHRFEALPGRLLLKTRFIADYLVEHGSAITVAPKPQADPIAIGNLLFGWAAGGLLIQRGTLALHGAAVATPQGAVVFCGESGVGKSTLSSQLMTLGLPLLDDNMAAIEVGGDSGLRVQPGLGSVRLMADSLDGIGQRLERTRLLPLIQPKYVLPLDATAQCRQALPLRAVYFLHRAAHAGHAPVAAADRVALLQANSFVVRFAPGLGAVPALFSQWLRIANAVPMHRLAVPMDRSAATWAREMFDELTA